MKALFLKDTELIILKHLLSESENKCYYSILNKVVKAEKQRTCYRNLISQIRAEVFREVSLFFERNLIEKLIYNGILTIGNTRLRYLYLADGNIIGECEDGSKHDISYSDKLFFIVDFLRKRDKLNKDTSSHTHE